MKLNELHVAQFRACTICGGKAVASCCSGIRALGINLRSAAGREQRCFRRAIREASFMLEPDSNHAIVLDNEIAEERKRSDRDAGTGSSPGEQRIYHHPSPYAAIVM